MIHHLSPHPCLSKSIDYYWFGEPGDEVIKVLPDGSASIILSFGDQIGYKNHRGEETIVDHNLLIGPHTKFYFINRKNTNNVIGIKFKQGGLYHLINKSIDKYHDTIIPLEQAYCQEIARLMEGLKICDKADEIKKSLNKYFFLKVTTKSKSSDKIDFALKALEINSNESSIQEISEQLNITNKHLITLFKEKVGLTPKQIHRLNKFNAVLKLLKGEKNQSWPSIAFACNYYDQAHLINEFKSFSGWSPTQYLQLSSDNNDQNILTALTNS